MSSLNKVKKNVTKRLLKFEPEMYTTPHGSLAISAFIFADKDKKPHVHEINKKWKYLVRHFNRLAITIDRPDFIEAVCKYFQLPVPENIAMVQSDFNMLFVPFVNGMIYPVREDGIYTATLRKGKIYPIVNGEKTDEFHEQCVCKTTQDI